jgi:hypothetical protein
VEESHSGDYICELLKKDIEKWKIDGKIIRIVSDSGRNMVNGIYKTNEKILPCSAHVLNLVTKDTFDQVKIKECIDAKNKNRIIFKAKYFDDNGSKFLQLINDHQKKSIEINNSAKAQLVKLRDQIKHLVAKFHYNDLINRKLNYYQEKCNSKHKVKPSQCKSFFIFLIKYYK